MSGNKTVTDRPPVVSGVLGGAAAWVLGYVFTFLIVGTDVQDSAAQRFIEAVGGEPATYEMVGWVFYNAHFVDTIYTDVPAFGSFTTTAVGGDGGFSPLLYLTPVGLLVAAGLAVGQYRDVDDPLDGITAGLTVVPGYLVLTVLGLFLFEVTLGGASGGPERLDAVLIAGLVYPAVFAGAGGVVATLTS
jgi:hypothetical protein